MENYQNKIEKGNINSNDVDSWELPLVVELLNESEKSELQEKLNKLVELKKESSEKKTWWEITESFGERAVPHILEEAHKLDYFSVGRFLNTVVSEKTAELVLKAMQKGKIGIYDSALAVAEGKEKTAKGLGEFLKKLKLSSSCDRSFQIKLLEALAETGVDDISPVIYEFYKDLRANKDYEKGVETHLQTMGNNLYECDALDTVSALAKIMGPKAHGILEELAQSQDEYASGYARQALVGKLYLGKPWKFKIEKPLEHSHYYSDSDSDLEDVPYDFAEDEDENESYPEIPEELRMGVKVKFLKTDFEWTEANTDELQNYWEGRTNVFEFLGKLKNKEGIKSPNDFNDNDRQKAILAVTVLESLRAILEAPVYKTMREASDNLKNSVEQWSQVIGDDGNSATVAAKEICLGLIQAINGIKQEDFRLPESAQSFELWHKGLQRSRKIRPFTESLRLKLQSHFNRFAFEILSGKQGPENIIMLLRRTLDFFRLYRDVSGYDVPLYEKASNRLEEIAKDKKKIFYGRDADYFYYAVKALKFGLDTGKDISKVYVNSKFRDILNNADWPKDEELRERIMAYLLQEKVTADAVHIDTGYAGTVPEAVLRALNPKLSEKEINECIKLLQSSYHGREQMTGGTIDTIEERHHHKGMLVDVIRDEKSGRLRIVCDKHDSWYEMEAWVIDQAIVRHFAPKVKV